MKFWKSKTTFRRKPIKNYVCYIAGTNKEHYLVNVAGRDIDKLKLGKSLPMMKKIWSSSMLNLALAAAAENDWRD